MTIYKFQWFTHFFLYQNLKKLAFGLKKWVIDWNLSKVLIVFQQMWMYVKKQKWK